MFDIRATISYLHCQPEKHLIRRESGLSIACSNICPEYSNVYPEYPGYRSDVRTHVRSIRTYAQSIRVASLPKGFSVHGAAPPYFGPMGRVSS